MASSTLNLVKRTDSILQLTLALLLLVVSTSVFATSAEVEPSKPSFEPNDLENGMLADLYEWLDGHGMHYVKDPSWPVKIVVDPTPVPRKYDRRGFHMIASRDIPEGEVLFSIPPAIQVESHTVCSDIPPYNATIAAANGHAWPWTENAAMAAWLVRERLKGNESAWAPFIRVQPSFVPVPMNFPDKLLQQLEHPFIINQTLRFRQQFNDEFASCSPDALSGGTKEQFFSALSLTLSRAFSHFAASAEVAPSGANPIVMLPLADMQNHDESHNTGWQREPDGSVAFRAFIPIPAGTPLINNYGSKSTHDFFLNYGFVPESNTYDFVTLAESPNDIAHLYLKYADQGGNNVAKVNPSIVSWIEVVVGRVNKEVGELKGEWEKANPDYDLNDPRFEMSGESYAVWSNGVVDPRLLASIAVVWHYFGYEEEADYSHLSLCAMWFGWRLAAGSCLQLAPACNASASELACLQSAAALIHSEAHSVWRSFTTSYQEDVHELERITECQYGFFHAASWNRGKQIAESSGSVNAESTSGGGDEGSDASSSASGSADGAVGFPPVTASDGSACDPEIEEWGEEMQLVLRYRMAKKGLLQQVMSRLITECMKVEDGGVPMNSDELARAQAEQVEGGEVGGVEGEKLLEGVGLGANEVKDEL